MRILLIASDYPPFRGGIARVMEELRRGFRPQEIRVFAPKDPLARKEPGVYRLPLGRGLVGRWIKAFEIMIWAFVLFFYTWIYQPNFVILGNLFPLGILGPFLKFTAGKRYIMFAYGGEIPVSTFFSPRRRAFASWVMNESSGVLCISKYTEKRVKALAYEVPTEIARLGVNTHFFSPGPANEEFRQKVGAVGKRVILCVSRLVKRKGIDTALRAFAKLAEKQSDVKLLISGDGKEKKELMELANQLKLGDKVRFMGEISDREIVECYRLANVFLFVPREEPYDVEGFGLVALEASACGVPVVASKCGGIPEAVLDQETGILVNEDNVPATVMALEQILNDPALAKRLGENGIKYADSRTWWKFSEQIHHIAAYFEGKRKS